ncbi:MAG: IS1182 family transposase [Methylibium sp.]|nr:IS1182 family transposase [Methylibium sp.]
MARYKPVERGGMLIPVMLHEQIQPGTFEFALDHLVDHELDLSALDARFNNDEVGASAYDPRVMLKIVLLAYSRGLISSRKIEQACEQNVLFMALSGDSRPSFTHIARFVRELGPEVQALFTQVLMICDRSGLIGKTLFAIDGVKLPANASKERSGTHAELAHRADRLERAAAKIMTLHQAQDEQGAASIDEQRQRRIDELRREAQATRDFMATHRKRLNRTGKELKTNVTDPDSAKMATSKGVIQGYAAQAAVDSERQIIVAAEVIGSGSEQAMLLPMIDKASPVIEPHTLITADAGYHSDANLQALHDRGIAAMVADNGMRRRDERIDNAHHKASGEVLHDKTADRTVKLFRPGDFVFNDGRTATCPAGKTLTGNGHTYGQRGHRFERYEASAADCASCDLRTSCLRNPHATRGRQVARFAPLQRAASDPSQRMREAIDSVKGRRLYSQRIAAVEPVFANIRHHKRMSRFTLRGRAKVSTQWQLYCLVHNVEKLAKNR